MASSKKTARRHRDHETADQTPSEKDMSTDTTTNIEQDAEQEPILPPASLPDLVTLPISEIKPYDNNPRRIPAEAVESLQTSIKAYGYQQPIVVDEDHVIIVGHTRRQALLELGVQEVPVYVAKLTEDQARQYRLVDNRTGEMSGWDYNQLLIELREWEQPLLDMYFPDVDLDIVTAEESHVTQRQINEATEEIANVPQNKMLLTTGVLCPSCLHEFQVATASLPGLTRVDIAELTNGGNARA